MFLGQTVLYLMRLIPLRHKSEPLLVVQRVLVPQLLPPLRALCPVGDAHSLDEQPPLVEIEEAKSVSV